MRKETVYKIYEMLQEQYVVNNLRDFVILSNESGEILYEFIKLCMDVMDEDNLRVLTNLSFSMDELKDLEYKKQTLKNINELLSNDYVRNDPNFYKILSGINFLLNYDYNQSYEIEYEEDLYFYISFTVDSLIEIIQNTLNENIDIDQLYMHDMSFLMDNYVNTVINLYQSTSNDNDLSFNDSNVFGKIISLMAQFSKQP